MRYTASFLSITAAGLFMLAVGTPMAHAQLSSTEIKCREGLANAAAKFVASKQKAIQKCNDQNLKAPGSCTSLPATLAKLETKVKADITKKCPLNNFNLINMGYPGRCPDSNPGDGFTVSDLAECIFTTHEAKVDQLMDIEYGNTTGPIAVTLQKCQSEIGKNAGKFLVAKLKLIQKCRNAIAKGKLSGFSAGNCATADPKTAAAIAKADSSARAKIAGKCTDADIAALDICNPNATTVTQAQNCIIQTHGDAVDTLNPVETDLIDIEYAAQPICGDGVKNRAAEECDAPDASACPGLCGGPLDDFPCLCTNIPRQRVVEHKEADLDNGWTGISHDSGIVEGGSYIVDLYDCDNVTDVVCTVGPSCSGAPHSPCSTDAQCSFLGQGSCRHRNTATGPHCRLNPQVTCNNLSNVGNECESDAACPGTGNCCQKQFHGAPLPLSSGGVSVCVINVFSEDVVGTTNLQDGSGAVRLRQNSVTYLGPVADQPCPVCGGFCAGNLGMGGSVGQRQRCSVDADCSNAPNHCVHDNICSYGANADKDCRPDPPFGGPTDLFGNPSVDCGPPPGAPISGPAGLDILFDPATTGSVQKLPTFECDNAAFASNRCVGGTSEGMPCTTVGDCPGGSCNEQCFCPAGGGRPEQPNLCNDACVGGSEDGQKCPPATCPGGFCHTADCRKNALDTGSSDEGACTAGPFPGICSTTKFKSCSVDTDCAAPACSFCDPGETCIHSKQQCFVNSGINRVGQAGVPNKKTVAVFCISATSSSAINNTAGLPGPGAITTPTTTFETGF